MRRSLASRLTATCTFGPLLFGVSLLALNATANAEVTMRMKGGDIAFLGEVKAFDGVRYTIMSRTFGELQLASQRFECVGRQCPANDGFDDCGLKHDRRPVDAGADPQLRRAEQA
jgi:hypothetical protein